MKKRCAVWALLLLVSAIVAAAPARADQRRFNHGIPQRHIAFEHGRFFFRQHVFFRPFFHPFFFFGRAVFAPVPLALFASPAYPAYLMGSVDGAPSCYDYQTTVVIGGQLQPAYGTACLGPDGNWQIVS